MDIEASFIKQINKRKVKKEIFYKEKHEGKKPTSQISEQKGMYLEKTIPIICQQQVVSEEKVFDGILDDRKKITDTRQYPYCCIGKVRMEFSKQLYHGTGCLIGPRLVLTCAHNIYERDKDKEQEATNLYFSPSEKEGMGKQFKVKKAHYPEQFKKSKKNFQSCKYDLAILELENDLSKSYGYLGIDTKNITEEKVQGVEICGYPSDKDDKSMWTAKEGLLQNENEFAFLHTIPTAPGQSGSPILKRVGQNWFVIGIHVMSVKLKEKESNVEGKKKKKESNVGVKLNEQQRNKINEWIYTEQLDLSSQAIDYEKLVILSKKMKEMNLSSLLLDLNRLKTKMLDGLTFANWKRVEKLSLVNNFIDDEGMYHLKLFSGLKELNVRQNKLTKLGVKILCKCGLSHLQKLNLSQNHRISDGIEFLLQIFTLKELDIQNIYLDQKGLKKFCQGKLALQSLILKNNDIGDESILDLQLLKQLSTLNLQNTGITDKGVESLSRGNFEKLRHLNLRDANYIEDISIQYLQSLKSLQKIELLQTDITQVGHEKLKQMTWLKEISFCQNKMEEELMEEV